MRLLRSLQPALAALLAACVLLLGWAAYSPALHDTLCDHAHEHQTSGAPEKSPAVGDDSAQDACAVVLFAAGCEAPPPPLSLAEPALNAIRVAHFTEFMLARTLRGPARVCGPPAAI
jgi:hypothetical protein